MEKRRWGVTRVGVPITPFCLYLEIHFDVVVQVQIHVLLCSMSCLF